MVYLADLQEPKFHLFSKYLSDYTIDGSQLTVIWMIFLLYDGGEINMQSAETGLYFDLFLG